MEKEFNGIIVRCIKADITSLEVDAIVNAANSRLKGGGGVDGAIHKAGGPKIMEECRKIGGCPTGSAVLTRAGNLKAKYVIHTVGPVYEGGNNDESNDLYSAYKSSLRLANEYKCVSVAFPSISTGVYNYPVNEAASIAFKAVKEFIELNDISVKLIVFSLFDDSTFSSFKKALEAVV